MPEKIPTTKGVSRTEVTTEIAVSFLGSNEARVLATPWLIAWLEMTARNAVKPHLLDGEDTVGTHVNVRHLAATPVGMTVRFEAEVVRVTGRRIEFRVAAWDDVEQVADGTHERAIINVAKFGDRLKTKRQRA
jgi:predicted thioesterase